jgi:hypothetical protein
MSNIFINRNRS